MSSISNALQILYYLNNNTHRLVSSDELSNLTETSKREVRRYCTDLIIAGFNLTSVTGPKGGYKLEQKLTLPLSLSEMDALLINLQIRNNSTLKSILNSASSVFNKLKENLVIGENELDNDTLTKLYQIELAIQHKKKISFSYTRYDKKDYIVSPYIFKVNNNVYRLVAVEESTAKQFRLKYMTTIKELETDFEIDERILSEYYSNEELGISRNSIKHEVKIEVFNKSKEDVQDFLRCKLDITAENKDSIIYTFKTSSISEAVYALLSLGKNVKVLDDKEVMEKYLDEVKQMYRMNYPIIKDEYYNDLFMDVVKDDSESPADIQKVYHTSTDVAEELYKEKCLYMNFDEVKRMLDGIKSINKEIIKSIDVMHKYNICLEFAGYLLEMYLDNEIGAERKRSNLKEKYDALLKELYIKQSGRENDFPFSLDYPNYFKKEYYDKLIKEMDAETYTELTNAPGRELEFKDGLPAHFLSIASSARYAYQTLHGVSLDILVKSFGSIRNSGNNGKIHFERRLPIKGVKAFNVPCMDAYFKGDKSEYFIETKCHEMFDSFVLDLSNQYYKKEKHLIGGYTDHILIENDFDIENSCFNIKQFLTHLIGIASNMTKDVGNLIYIYYVPKRGLDQEIDKVIDKTFSDMKKVFSSKIVRDFVRQNKINLKGFYYEIPSTDTINEQNLRYVCSEEYYENKKESESIAKQINKEGPTKANISRLIGEEQVNILEANNILDFFLDSVINKSSIGYDEVDIYNVMNGKRINAISCGKTKDCLTNFIYKNKDSYDSYTIVISMKHIDLYEIDKIKEKLISVENCLNIVSANEENPYMYIILYLESI